MLGGVLRVDLSEVQAVRLTCNNCGGAVSMPISDGSERFPEYCPICHTEWPLREGPQRLPAPSWRLLMLLRDLRVAQEQGAPTSVQIEFHAKEATL